jgi:hypothetical protein
LRFDFTPFVGYRTGMSFPIEPHVTGTNPHVALDASPSYGVSFGVRLEEDGLVEIRWARQDSYIHSEDVSVSVPRQRVTLGQFHGDFSREYIVDEWRPWARPFVLLSVGATHVSNSAELRFTRFSFGIGGGGKVLSESSFGLQDAGRVVADSCGPTSGLRLRLGLHRSRRRLGKFPGRSLCGTSTAILIRPGESIVLRETIYFLPAAGSCSGVSLLPSPSSSAGLALGSTVLLTTPR